MTTIGRRPTILLLASAGVGCWTLTSDVDGLAGGGAHSASPDASTQGVPDAGGGTSDAGATADAAPAPRGCAGLAVRPKVCDDFDQGAPLVNGWSTDNAGLTAHGSADLRADFAFSLPSALRIALTTSPSCTYERIERTGPRSYTPVGVARQELRARVRPSTPWAGQFGVLTMYVDDGGPSLCGVVVNLGGNGASVNAARLDVERVSAATESHTLPDAPRALEWTDVGMVVTPAPNGVSVDVSFTHPDGTVQSQKQVVTQCALGTKLAVGVGFHCATGSAEIRYDDVRVDWQ